MSKSRNDYLRNTSKLYDDEDSGEYRALKERRNHRYEKRINSALRKLDIESLYDDDQDY